MKIEDLINEEQIILKSLEDNRQKQRDLYTNEFILRNGINIGDIVETDANFFTKSKVVEFVYLSNEETWLLYHYPDVRPCGVILSNLRTDGKLGVKQITLCEDTTNFNIRPLKVHY